jgi:hypothetical protein
VFLPTLSFLCFFLFHADMSTCYWWAKKWWFCRNRIEVILFWELVFSSPQIDSNTVSKLLSGQTPSLFRSCSVPAEKTLVLLNKTDLEL